MYHVNIYPAHATPIAVCMSEHKLREGVVRSQPHVSGYHHMCWGGSLANKPKFIQYYLKCVRESIRDPLCYAATGWPFFTTAICLTPRLCRGVVDTFSYALYIYTVYAYRLLFQFKYIHLCCGTPSCLSWFFDDYCSFAKGWLGWDQLQVQYPHASLLKKPGKRMILVHT